MCVCAPYVCMCYFYLHVQDMDKESDLHLRFRKPHFDINHGADKPRLELRKVCERITVSVCCITTYRGQQFSGSHATCFIRCVVVWCN
jgi:hypothetical protein